MRQRTWTIGAVAATLVIALVPMGRMGGLLAQQAAQESEEGFQNLQILDPNITKDELKPIMDGFTEMLGVNCTHCHILDEYNKDDLEHKVAARKMIRLVGYLRQNISTYYKADLDPETITCWTCHRGEAEPKPLTPEDDDWM